MTTLAKTNFYSPIARRERFSQRQTNNIPSWKQVPYKTKSTIKKEYTFDRTIGEGASGFVLLGKQIDTSVSIAAKLLSLEHDISSFALLESKLLATISHAAVPLVIDLFRDDEFVYIIQEFVSGIPLFDHMVEETFSEDECQIIIYQLLDLLDYLHQNDIIHGDIKPENIIYSKKTKKMYLLDFGSAKILNGPIDTITGGSIGYLAPEIIISSNSITPKSDMWSVGVLLYTMISGTPPFFSDSDARKDSGLLQNAPFWYFYNNNTENLRSEILAGKVDLSGVSPMLANLLSKLFQVDPRKRISSGTALKHAWFAHRTNRILRVNQLKNNV